MSPLVCPVLKCMGCEYLKCDELPFRDLAREEAEAYIYKRVKEDCSNRFKPFITFSLQSAFLIEILPYLYKETEGICLYLAESGARVHILSFDKVSESKPSWKSSSLWPWVPISLHLQKEGAFSLCPFLRALLCPLVPVPHSFLLSCCCC